MKTSTVMWIAGIGVGAAVLYLVLRPGEEVVDVVDPVTGAVIGTTTVPTGLGLKPTTGTPPPAGVTREAARQREITACYAGNDVFNCITNVDTRYS
jgi:hypothetical protein